MTAGTTVEGNGMPSAANVELLLGVPGQSSLPMWLKPDMFLSPTFDPEACVADLRRFAPLSTLQTELQAYLATLKAKMVEVINEDYQDYVNLSAKLVNVDGAVMRMRKPLLELKDKLGVVAEAVRGELSALGAGLRKRKEVAMARNLLELLQELAHVASKVEKLLAEVTGAEGIAADVDTRSRLLERLAGEVSRLSFQANRGKDLAFVRAMEPRIAAARSTLQEALSEALTAALESKQHTPALHCLHAYAELGLTEQAEDALRRLVVGPIVRRVIIDHKSTHTIRASAAAASGAREDVLGSVLRGVEKEVVAAAGPLLTAALTPQSPLRVFDFLGNVLLAEVDAQLSSNMPAVFSPGVPPAFHANYLAAQAFLESLEARCLGRTAMDRLRASPAYAAFNKQWNTSVYFSLFYQEVAGEVEDAAAAGKPDLGPALTTRASGGSGGGGSGGGSSGAPGGVVLPLSSAVIKGLGRCASPAVFLQTLADKFLKLALQLGQRYVSWAAAAVAARQAQASSQAAAAGLRKVPSATGVAGTTPGDDPTAAASAEGPAGEGLASPGSGGPAAPGAAWVASLALDDLACLYGDLVAVAGHVRGVFAPAFTGLLGNLPEEVVVGVRQGIEDVADQIEAQGGSLLTVMSDEVAEACVGLVRQLKGITATYRMTTKGPPTRHSHYVASVLGPLKQLLEGPRVSRLPQAAQQQLAAAVVNIVTGRYQVLAEELLNTVRKTESSLKRLKKVQQSDAGDASGLSDSDKITLQLYLDVHEYAQQVSRFGLTPATIPSYAGLLQAVTPPPAVLAAVGQPAAH